MQTPPPNSVTTRARILVVESVPDVRDALSVILEAEYEVVTAPGVDEARKLARERAFDAALVSLDLLPLGSSDALIASLCSDELRIPTAITSLCRDDGLATSERLGARYAPKTENVPELLRTVAALVANRSPRPARSGTYRSAGSDAKNGDAKNGGAKNGTRSGDDR